MNIKCYVIFNISMCLIRDSEKGYVLMHNRDIVIMKYPFNASCEEAQNVLLTQEKCELITLIIASKSFLFKLRISCECDVQYFKSCYYY